MSHQIETIKKMKSLKEKLSKELEELKESVNKEEEVVKEQVFTYYT